MRTLCSLPRFVEYITTLLSSQRNTHHAIRVSCCVFRFVQLWLQFQIRRHIHRFARTHFDLPAR
jgi:hypothetical protein